MPNNVSKPNLDAKHIFAAIWRANLAKYLPHFRTTSKAVANCFVAEKKVKEDCKFIYFFYLLFIHLFDLLQINASKCNKYVWYGSMEVSKYTHT